LSLLPSALNSMRGVSHISYASNEYRLIRKSVTNFCRGGQWHSFYRFPLDIKKGTYGVPGSLVCVLENNGAIVLFMLTLRRKQSTTILESGRVGNIHAIACKSHPVRGMRKQRMNNVSVKMNILKTIVKDWNSTKRNQFFLMRCDYFSSNRNMVLTCTKAMSVLGGVSGVRGIAWHPLGAPWKFLGCPTDTLGSPECPFGVLATCEVPGALNTSAPNIFQEFRSRANHGCLSRTCESAYLAWPIRA